jgi:hypothetical protein
MSNLTAIDVLIDPDEVTIERARAVTHGCSRACRRGGH